MTQSCFATARPSERSYEIAWRGRLASNKIDERGKPNMGRTLEELGVVLAELEQIPIVEHMLHPGAHIKATRFELSACPVAQLFRPVPFEQKQTAGPNRLFIAWKTASRSPSAKNWMKMATTRSNCASIQGQSKMSHTR